MPTMPHSAAGWRIEPPVSVPSAQGASPAATAAALPPEEPPGTRSRSHGLRTGPYAAERGGRAVLRGSLADPREAVEAIVARGAIRRRALVVGVEQLLRRQRPGSDRLGRRAGGELEDVGRAHACGLGTRKPSSLA